MQRWLAHSNWVDVQNLSAKDAKENLFSLFARDRKSGFPCEKRSWKKTRGSFQEQYCSRLTAVRLIGSVLTVVLFITRPAHWNTAATGAGEEVDRTFKFSLVCNRSEQDVM